MFLHVSVILLTACLAGLQGWGWVVSQHALQVSRGGGGWYPSMPCRSGGVVSQHALQVSRPTPKGEVEGSGLGVSRPTPRGVSRPIPRGVSRSTPRGWSLQAHTWGGGYPTMHRGRPPSRWLLLQVVCILLECILVLISNWSYLFS